MTLRQDNMFKVIFLKEFYTQLSTVFWVIMATRTITFIFKETLK